MAVYEIETQRIIRRTYHVEADSPSQAKQLLADELSSYWAELGSEWDTDETVSKKRAKKLPA